MTIAEMLKKAITQALQNLGIPEIGFTVEHPVDLSHGDYATNVAMIVAKSLGKSPKEVAQMVMDEMNKQKNLEIAKIEIAGPGFINFTLSPEFFVNSLRSILDHEKDFGNVSIYNGKKILVEHSSPNLFKPFHIGHMMNNAIGESLTRLMKASGAEVTTMSFPSDISIGIAKAVFVILEKYGTNFIPVTAVQLGDSYVEGTQRYDEDETIHGRIKEISDNLYAGNDSPEWEVFQKCKHFNIAYFETIVGQLGSHFDSYIYESEAGEVGKKIVMENTPKIFTESEGAVVYVPDEAKKNLNTAVFINSQGNPTYGAKDIGLLDLKFRNYSPDLSLFVTDHEQVPHFNIVLDAAEKINTQWAEKSIHIAHGRMSLKGQKMSSRLGGVPLVTEMIDMVSAEVAERAKDRQLDETTKSAIAIAALKFTILRAKPGQNINFDPETSLSFEGDSGPYLQYTHARICSLIEKGNAVGITADYKTEQPVSDLEKILYRFPEIVEKTLAEYAPNHITTYLISVAQAFNSFYGANQIIDPANREISEHRLAIARATQIVLKNGLQLLGIVAPEKM